MGQQPGWCQCRRRRAPLWDFCIVGLLANSIHPNFLLQLEGPRTRLLWPCDSPAEGGWASQVAGSTHLSHLPCTHSPVCIPAGVRQTPTVSLNLAALVSMINPETQTVASLHLEEVCPPSCPAHPLRLLPWSHIQVPSAATLKDPRLPLHGAPAGVVLVAICPLANLHMVGSRLKELPEP